MMAELAQSIAAWVADKGRPAPPPSAVELVQHAFLDTIGVALLGSRMAAPRAVAAVQESRSSAAIASIFGMRRKVDALSAALVNGTSSHAELFDDNNAPMIAHPSGPLVCSLLPLAQWRGGSGEALLDAYATGFEVGVKLGRMVNPAHYERGWHATRTLGIFGATAACARLLRLDADRVVHAIGIAASMASGLRQNFGTMTMPLHVGLTAHDAMHAALLAEAGLRADAAALEGKYGFFEVFVQQAPRQVTLGEPLELGASGIIFKPYPSGAPTHAAVDAALALRDALGADVRSIETVRCLVHPWNAMTLRDEAPRDPLQAKVNLRFCVAAALAFGRLSWREFTDEVIADPVVQEIMSRTQVEISSTLPDNGEFPAEVQLQTYDGRLLAHRNDVPPGGSTRPLDAAAIEAKFRDCAAAILPARTVAEVLQTVSHLDTLENVDSLCEMLEAR